MTNDNTHNLILDKAKRLLELREGVKYVVYKDTLGHLTVGIGHLVTPEDNLKLGDRVTQEQVDFFYRKDVMKAFEAAKAQAKSLQFPDNVDLIVILISVNYQLGTGWTRTFSSTWKHLLNKNYDTAIHNLRRSLWYKQTPVRVQDFIEAITKLPDYYYNKKR